jgi:hypothetical protein
VILRITNWLGQLIHVQVAEILSILIVRVVATLNTLAVAAEAKAVD